MSHARSPRCFVGAILLLLLTTACDRQAPSTSPTSPSSSSTPPTPGPSTASASAAVSDPLPVPARGQGALGTMPPGAMVYMVARPTAVDQFLAALPAKDRAEAQRELQHELGLPAVDGKTLVSKLSLDPKRPIVMAFVPAPAAELMQVARWYATQATQEADKDKVTQRAKEITPPLVGLTRLRVPLAGEATALLGVLEKALRGAKRRACPGSPICKSFPGKPVAVIVSEGDAVVAAYVAAGSLTVEVATPYWHEPDDAVVLAALAAFHERRGGPGPKRCQNLDLEAVASMCIGTEAAVQWGQSSGTSMALGAVTAKSVAFEMSQRIMKVGMEEVDNVRQIALRKPRLFADGTLTVKGELGAPHLVASWAATEPKVKEALTRAFAKQRCGADLAGIRDTLLPELRAALGLKGKAAPARELIEQIQVSGSAGWVVVAASAWPHYLAVFDDSQLAPRFGAGKTCLRFAADRLEIDTALPSPLFE